MRSAPRIRVAPADDRPWEIEPRWQRRWLEDRTFEADDPATPKPRGYPLEMLPYASERLHIGDVRNDTMGDVIARFQRMRRFSVFHPIGASASRFHATPAGRALPDPARRRLDTVSGMHFGAILLLALGLAMDATAVAAARGLATPRIRPRHVLLVAGLFGGFQALMPVVGWLVGARVGTLVESWDHWIAFALLLAIGGKMLWEARGGAAAPGDAGGTTDLFGLKVLIVLAVATSIDALAVGITLPMLDAPFMMTIATIGVVTALSSAAGLLAGRRFGATLGRRLDVAGGLVLIGLGTKILLEHLLGG